MKKKGRRIPRLPPQFSLTTGINWTEEMDLAICKAFYGISESRARETMELNSEEFYQICTTLIHPNRTRKQMTLTQSIYPRLSGCVLDKGGRDFFPPHFFLGAL